MSEKKKSDALSRTITGLVLAGLMFLILWLSSFSQIIFDMFILLFGAMATFEVYKAVKKADTGIIDKRGYNISGISLIVVILIIYPLIYFFSAWGLLFVFSFAILVAFVHFIFDEKKTLGDFGMNLFVIIYPMFFLGIMFLMGRVFGMIPVILPIGIALISDAMAYWIGRTFGKKKIFPKISPKKTYAGCLGGLIGGMLGGIIVYLIFELGQFPTNTIFTFSNIVKIPVLLYAFIGLVLAAVSEIGDLAASRVKRSAGIKDYGSILGSHGGAMDRIDSILFTTAGMFLIMILLRM